MIDPLIPGSVLSHREAVVAVLNEMIYWAGVIVVTSILALFFFGTLSFVACGVMDVIDHVRSLWRYARGTR